MTSGSAQAVNIDSVCAADITDVALERAAPELYDAAKKQVRRRYNRTMLMTSDVFIRINVVKCRCFYCDGIIMWLFDRSTS